MLTRSKWAIFKATEGVFVSRNFFFFFFGADQTAASSLDSSQSLHNKNISVKITRFYEVSAFCEVQADFEINSRKCDSIWWREETGNVSTKEALQQVQVQDKKKCSPCGWVLATCRRHFLLQAGAVFLYDSNAYSSHCMNGLSRLASTCTCSSLYRTW